ncbi:MAG: helix-turn-helix domain-containing protein [Minwuia sp.]|nr:helix-turn-helix domain-containing protein [Minwuia sp.]
MSRADLSSSACTVARAVAAVGDEWTLLILREMFLGSRRFDDFLRQTGMSSHLLSQRLKKLVALGVVRRSVYSDRPLRHEYILTEMGKDLWPIIVAMKQWGDRWLLDGVPPVQIVHKSCECVTHPQMTCSECGEPMQARDARARLTRGFSAVRGGTADRA